MSVERFLAAAVLATIAISAALAPTLPLHTAHEQHAEYPYAPPVRPRIVGTDERWHLPFVYRLHLVDRLDRRYAEDEAVRIPLVGSPDPRIFLLGTDALGRDVLARLLMGARNSLGIALMATTGALLIGVIVGALSGYRPGMVDEIAMRITEAVLVLPVLYVVLALRAALPLVMSPLQVVAGVSLIFAAVGWPVVARGVRAIVISERARDYVEAARASGASRWRILSRHILPSVLPFVALQTALLVPAFVIAEAALSFAGFGFAEPTPSWGTMLQEAGDLRALGDYPWLLAPAFAIATLSWAMHTLADGGRGSHPDRHRNSAVSLASS
jgi:peptide/nickel transport system permease protein